MSQEDAVIMGLVVSALMGLFGIALGIVAADAAWRHWLARKGIAQYNPRNGRWELEEKWRDEKPEWRD